MPFKPASRQQVSFRERVRKLKTLRKAYLGSDQNR